MRDSCRRATRIFVTLVTCDTCYMDTCSLDACLNDTKLFHDTVILKCQNGKQSLILNLKKVRRKFSYCNVRKMTTD